VFGQTEIERLKMTAATAAAFTAVGTYVFPRGVLASALYANLERRWGAEKQADSFRAQRKL
jgi:hypothetical protein